jgi:hypothetical protein
MDSDMTPDEELKILKADWAALVAQVSQVTDPTAGEVERLRADAARYRWLAENAHCWAWNPSRYNDALVSGFSYGGTGYLGYSLEQAIALAMAKEAK